MAGGDFVGREAEERVLAARLEQAVSGAGGLVRVTGEPGIGKTALVQRLVARAREQGVAVAWAACWQTAAVPALWPWTQALGQLASAFGGGVVPDLDAAGAGDLDAARTEQSERVAAWLRSHPAAPALVVLDDLQWADAGTLQVLVHVLGGLPAMPVLVVATARPVAPGDGSPYSQLLAEPRRLGEEVRLDGLGEPDCAALIAAASGVAPTDDVVHDVRALTAGNPLFVRELSRGLGVGRDLATQKSVTDLIAGRVSHLSDRCRTVLDVLAVAGDEADLDVLATVAGVEPLEALDALDEARRAGLVEVGDATVRFAHALFRAAVYELLSLSGRARRHDAIARALLARRDAGAPVDAAALAHHFGRSAPLGNGALAMRFAREAAAEAARLLSFDLAARRLEQALALVSMDATLGQRLPLLLELADALVACGAGDRARATFADAAAEARKADDAEALGRAALGFSGGMAGIEVVVGDPSVCALLGEAAAALAGDLVLGPQVEARLSVASSYLRPLEERRPLAQRARRRAGEGGDPTAIAQTGAAWLDMVAGPDHVAERLAASTDIVDAGLRLGDPRVETLGRRHRVEALLESGDLAGADAEASRYAAAAGRLGRPEYGWYPALWRAALAFVRGDEQAHARHRADLAASAAGGGGPNAALLALVHDVTCAFDLHDPARLSNLLAGVEDLGVPAEAVQFRTSLAFARGLETGGRDTGEPLGPLVSEALAAAQDSEWLPMMAQLAELAVLAGDRPAGERLRDAISPYAGVWVIEGIGAGIRGPAHRWLARLAALTGDAADTHRDAARHAVLHAGAHLLVAAIDREWGEPAPRQHAPNRFALDGETWSLTFAGTTASVRDSKGLRDLARLVAEPGREVAALDLAAPGPSLVEAGAGDHLDAQARAAYTNRLRELEDELDEADAAGDVGRSSRLTAERDALVDQLTGAYGLGGRSRSAGGSAERARTAVRARIRDALGRIEAVHPALGRHLRRSVRTGTFCVYDPDPPVDWER